MTDHPLHARLASLQEILRALGGEPDSRRLYETAVQGLRALLDAPAALAIGLAPGHDAPVPVIEAQSGVQLESASALPACVGRALAERRAVVDGDGVRASLSSPLRAALAAPLLRDGRAAGALVAAHTDPGKRFAPHELTLAEILAEHVSLALVNAANVATAARHLARVEEHSMVLRRIADAHARDRVIERALDAGLTLFGADRAAIYLCNAREDVTSAYGRRLSRRYMEAVARAYRGSAGGLLLRTLAPIYVPDLVTDPRTRVLHEAARAEGVHTGLLVPLTQRGRPLGALALYHDIAWSYDGEDIALARSFADQLSLSIADAALHEQSAQRKAEIRLLGALAAALAVPSEPGDDPAGRCLRALEALVAGGVPSAWVYTGAGDRLERLAHAGASALDARLPEQAARAAIERDQPVLSAVQGAAPLIAAPLGRRAGALVLAPPRTTAVEPRTGTLVVLLDDGESWPDLEPFVATAAAQLGAQLTAWRAEAHAALRGAG